MLTWSPDLSASPWLEVQEDEVWSMPEISAIDDSVPPLLVKSYSAAVSGSPLIGLVVVSSPSGVLVSAPKSLVGAFPAIDIEYQINGTTGHCLSFSALPSNADEVIKFTPNPSSVESWNLSITAVLSDGTFGVVTLVITVYANFTPGCIALKEAVNARRH